MACIHKFAADLFLERLNFEPNTLIVGTFNPSWDNLGNYAPWFYGRTRNNYFWDVLPKLYEDIELRKAHPNDWKAFCHRNKVALTDLIYAIDDAEWDNPQHVEQLKNYRDDAIARYFKQFTFVEIPGILAKHPSIRQVYLTRQLSGEFWHKIWRPIDLYCQCNAIQTHTLLTPSGSARFQMPKDKNIALRDFIFMQWQNNWHSLDEKQ